MPNHGRQDQVRDFRVVLPRISTSISTPLSFRRRKQRTDAVFVDDARSRLGNRALDSAFGDLSRAALAAAQAPERGAARPAAPSALGLSGWKWRPRHVIPLEQQLAVGETSFEKKRTCMHAQFRTRAGRVQRSKRR